LWNRSLQVSGSQSCGAAQCQNQTKSLDKDPQCVKCGSTMRVSCTEPDKPGFVHHVYECIKRPEYAELCHSGLGRLSRWPSGAAIVPD
jgi:hypothetical protein